MPPNMTNCHSKAVTPPKDILGALRNGFSFKTKAVLKSAWFLPHEAACLHEVFPKTFASYLRWLGLRVLIAWQIAAGPFNLAKLVIALHFTG